MGEIGTAVFIYLAQKSINHVTTVKFLVSKSQNALRLKCRTTMSNSTNRELVKFICYVFLAYLLDKSVKAVPGDYVGRYEILFNCCHTSHSSQDQHLPPISYCRLYIMQKLWTSNPSPISHNPSSQ